MDDHTVGELYNGGIDREDSMPENESINEFGFIGPIQDDVRHFIR